MAPKNIRFLVSVALSITICGLFTACANNNNQPAPSQQNIPTPQESYLEHTISFSGETLAEIAAWYTGRGLNWTAIRDANPSIRPDRLRLGQIILIPRSLVTNEKPFTRKSSKKTAKTPEPAPEAKATPASGEPAAAPTEVPTPSPTEAPALTPTEPTAAPTATPEPTLVPTVVPTATPEAAATKANSKDLEREKLLDELLK